MKLTMFGTGNALVTECYNTCFAIQDNGQTMLVDGGGGSTLLTQLKSADIAIQDIHDIFVTHKHIDHIMGIVWIIRIIAQSINRNRYHGNVRIYAHKELIELIGTLCSLLLEKKQNQYIGNRIELIEVSDGETKNIIGNKVTFFDIHSTKAKQFGFYMIYNGSKKLTCCGDEPCNPSIESHVEGSDWLLHEAFCLYAQADIYKPYEKNHSTVRDAAELAEKLNVRNLLLYHTEDDNIRMRKSLYIAEAAGYFHGRTEVPDDLESIIIL